jgi:tetratricopeptide (TPR) repeat protein
VSRETSNKHLQDGIQNLKNEQKAKAMKNFADAVQSDPLNASAWYMLEQVVEDSEKKKYCHDRAVALDSKIDLPGTKSKELSDNSKSVPVENRPPLDEFVDSTAGNIGKIAPEQTSPVSSKKQKNEKSIENNNLESKGTKKKNGVLFPFFVSMLIGFLVLMLPIIYLVRSGFFDPLQPYLSQFVPTPSIIESPVARELTQAQPPTPDIFIQTPGLTPTIDETKKYALLQEKINEAYKAYSEADYTTAIPIFNEALELDPGNAEFHARLGKSYYLSIDGLRDYQEYSNYLSLALENYDQAIKIDPTQEDYYVWRGITLEFIGVNQIFRETREQYLIAAQKNLELGILLGSDEFDIPPILTTINRYLGNCDLSLQESEQRNTVESSIDSREALAQSYICLGKYQKALDSLGENSEFISGKYARVKALYALGKYDEALAILKDSVDKKPGYSGERYYWKALIEYEQGLKDQAWTDLLTGEGNTWGRTPIYYYLYSKYFQSQDDMDQAKSMMQYAEAALGPQDGPLIAKMVNEGLKELDVEPLEMNLDPEYPIIALPDIKTIQALVASKEMSTTDLIYYPEGYKDAMEAAFEDGIMGMRIPPRTTNLIHFTFNEPLDITNIQNLSIQVEGDTEEYQNLKFAIFMPNGGYRFYYPALGSDNISFPKNYLFSDHDLYIALIDPDYNEAVFFSNFGITATVTLGDGSTRVIGYQIEGQP